MISTGYKQPKGFSVFFLTEMWERYGFYVLQTLLVFYLLKELHLSDKEVYVITGSFTALAYINCIFGGMIADRFIGSSNAVIVGGVALFVGYCLLASAIDSRLSTISLGLITVGTGLLKPNISSLLSILYPEENEQFKDSGYTLYYVGIYVGALGGSLLGGYIQKHMGWSLTFFSAAIAILLGMIIFVCGKFKYKLFDSRKQGIHKRDCLLAMISILLMFLVSCAAIHSEFLSNWIMIVIALFCLGLMLFCICIHHGNKKLKLIAFSGLVLLLVCYWAINFQQFFSIALAIKRTASLPFPPSSMSSVESLGIIIFGPIISYIWFYFKNKNIDVSIPAKFSLGFLFNSLCFLILAGGLWYASCHNIYFNGWFILPAYLLLAIGELCISPTSLAMVTTLVPKKYASMMMGIALLSIGFGGGKIAGLLATESVVDTKMHNLAETQTIYVNAFFIYFLISVVMFIVSLILGRYINKLINIK